MEATEKMCAYAKVISETLNLKEPNYKDFEETSNFIASNAPVYKKQCYRQRVEFENDTPRFKYKRKLIKFLDQYYGKHGCYILWHKKNIVYIGKSINLAERVIASIQERNRSIEITGLTLVLTDNEADTHILEPVLITELKPILNTEFYCKDKSLIFKSGINYTDLKQHRILFSELKGDKDYEKEFCTFCGSESDS